MQIYVGQMYTEAGVSYPFSTKAQGILGDRLSSLVEETNDYLRRFGNDWSVMLRVDARVGLDEPSFSGPMLFKKDKDLEYFLYLPYDRANSTDYGSALGNLLDAAVAALADAGLKVDRVLSQRDEIISNLLSDPRTIRQRDWS